MNAINTLDKQYVRANIRMVRTPKATDTQNRMKTHSMIEF